jgi:hypothetical protein
MRLLIAYLLVGLIVGLGCFIVCRPGRGDDRGEVQS